jgi:hypothetical protein
MYDIANKLAERFEEADLDQLLLLIKSPFWEFIIFRLISAITYRSWCIDCGSSLRAEDPGSLKEFIQIVNQKAADGTSFLSAFLYIHSCRLHTCALPCS